MPLPCLTVLLLVAGAGRAHAVRLGVGPSAKRGAGGGGGKKKDRLVTTKPFTGPLFFMHLPKAAGDSFMTDSPKYCGQMLKGAETNFCKAHSGPDGTLERNVVAMVRDPRAHVLSMYFHCKTGHEYLLSGWSSWMPDRIIEWLRPWAKAGANSADVLHRFCCYDPVNLQSRRFSCSQGLTVAKRNIERAFFVGLVEHYHVSLCLLGIKVNGSVPKGCNCADKQDAELRHQESHLNHGVELHSASHLPAAHLDLIDNMTREDVVIYEMARAKFWAEVERVERIYRVRVACDQERATLRQRREAVVQPPAARAQARPPRPRAAAPAEPLGDPQAAAVPPPLEPAAAMPHVRARVPARPPARAAAPALGPPPPAAEPGVVALSAVRHLVARPRAPGREDGTSLLSLASQAAASGAAAPAEERRGGCPNENYLLEGVGLGR